jgi:DNA-binding response OmpR family regulator
MSANPKPELLLVEDEEHLAHGLRFNFEAEGYNVSIVPDGESALVRLLEKNDNFDAVILDVMLPGMDGFQVVTQLRAAGRFVPVIILTARGRGEDVLKGFASGADDYLPKPFEFAILLARVRGLLRRRAWSENQPTESAEPSEVFRFDGKTIDFGALEVRAGKNQFHLTQMEAGLLRHMVRNSGKVVSRASLLQDVWGLRHDTDTRAIDNFIVRLRRYIEDDPVRPKHLITVRGVGYKFVPGI